MWGGVGVGVGEGERWERERGGSGRGDTVPAKLSDEPNVTYKPRPS